MRKLALTFTALAMATTFLAPTANAAFDIREADVFFANKDGSAVTQAGAHPFEVRARIFFNTKPNPVLGYDIPFEDTKDLISLQIPGLVGKPDAVSKCGTVEFLAKPIECPADSQVGINTAYIDGQDLDKGEVSPIYSLVPPAGVAMRLGFRVTSIVPIVMDLGIDDKPPNRVIVKVTNIPTPISFYGAELTLWGIPGDPAHDSERRNPTSCPSGCPSGLAKVSLLTLPGACEGPLETTFAVDSWQNPGAFVSKSAVTNDGAAPPNPQGFTGCSKLGFNPVVEALPTTNQAETGTGFDFSVGFDDEGLLNPDGLAESQIRKAVVTMPEGMTINPSIGEGLGVCTPADFEREKLDTPPGAGCPNPSKIGTLHVDSPLIEDGIDGAVFLAQQDDPATTTTGAENPFDSLIALHMVLRNEKLGVLIKQSLKVEPDPATGQLVATLDDVPQVPFSRFNFHFKEGQRAPLVTPNACGTYATKAEFFPWSDPTNPRTVNSTFEITGGVGGGACPGGGVPPFNPDFEAGAINNNAGSFSPFNMRLLRNDGEQDMTKFSSILPPGQIGSLAGVGKCPDVAVAMAKSRTGRQELAAPSCPADSQIGRTLAGAGVGSALTYVPGRLYLGGPYKGAPLSVIAITPAVAGPFDAGTIAVRLGLDLNPRTAEVEVDGSASDPIPHILKGIVLKLRDLRVYVDRPNFTLNPTSCDESSTKATLFGSYLDVFSSADDVSIDQASRYQAANCLNLGFRPRLTLALSGGTKRGGHPGLKAIYMPRQGDANLKGLVVRLPRSAFLEQGHIRTICTRVQFAANACPKAAQYGYIRAWTPLLDEPLQGPVWLRSSSNKLPDMVFDLKGLVDVELATKIDSQKGGIRAVVVDAPDAPIAKVELRMQGGKKGLIVNSRSLCAAPSRATVQFSGHNGKRYTAKPVMRPKCGGKSKRAKR